jgi:hypothetical protein
MPVLNSGECIMSITSPRNGRVSRAGAVLAAVVTLAVGAACGGGGSSDTPTTVITDPPTTEVLVKNRPLNNCVSVMSGERPKPGVTIPRCQPNAPKR